MICGKTIYDIIVNAKLEKIRATSGTLNGFKSDKVLFRVAGSSVGFWTDKNDFNFFGTSNIPLIKGRLVDGILNIDAQIRNERGDLIAGLQDNTWTMYRNDYEYNNNENSFEVVTPIDRKVLFQIRLYKETVDVAGLLVDQDRTGLYLFASNKGAAFKKYGDTLMPIPDSIPKMFYYPRSKYIGKANEDYPVPVNGPAHFYR